MPAPKAASAKGHGSLALLKKSWYFWPLVSGRASLLAVVLKVAITPKTLCFSCCLSCSSAVGGSISAVFRVAMLGAGTAGGSDSTAGDGVPLFGDVCCELAGGSSGRFSAASAACDLAMGSAKSTTHAREAAVNHRFIANHSLNPARKPCEN